MNLARRNYSEMKKYFLMKRTPIGYPSDKPKSLKLQPLQEINLFALTSIEAVTILNQRRYDAAQKIEMQGM
ncbi:MAG: hypothetical protein ACUVQV_06800 [Dissulfurimicrobium sp.]|uniref:hypothetical protein n=1 Tax=Dissulfurimicrobium sp. TaxID=2022436 RepID=UPI004049552B